MAENVPQMIGKYRIMGLVAKGGMGAVYKAVHPTLKRMVILKKLTIKGNATIRERFKREAQILLDMQSPYIVHLFDYFVEGNSHYIVEEFVDGLSLAQVIEKQVSLGTELSLLVFLDACYALKFAHARGIVHRDIKPGNILISRRAEVKLADFGIAASDDIEEIAVTKSERIVTKVAGDVTQTGVTLGTPAYMSPEQIMDSRSVDNRADIYSMGVMLYEMLTGSKPFDSTISEENLQKIRKGKYINPRKIDRSIPPVISRMIKKMLKGNPDKRYKSIDSVIKIIKRYLRDYDTHTIRISLAQIILAKNQFVIPEFEKKSRLGVKITSYALAAVALFSIGMYAWNAGIFHASILSPWYKPVTLNLVTPIAGVQNNIYGLDIPVKAYFFDESDADLPEVQGSRRDFKNSEGIVTRTKSGKRISASSAQNIKYLTIKPVYLKDGFYRVKVLIGSYVMWSSFAVNGDCVNLNFDNLQKVKRQVTVQTRAFDAETGELLTSKTEFTVLYNGRYVPFSQVPPKELVSGKVMKIHAECKGYKLKEFSMIIDWYQDTLFVNAGLEK
ncbi:MAG: serine/threonine-protein kinase [Treponema sp.]|uniref:serine/threonine protein kinase n=1 Tax=Treponema sp. TaxID=166 RepID=UPI002A91C7D9|nr:serine/threonine-protein kinase [Treponema sp.]MDY6396193.1 serine/threonine-protein kinase [Treponema sp.]